VLIVFNCSNNRQGAYKSWKVIEFKIQVFHAWKVVESGLGPWKSQSTK